MKTPLPFCLALAVLSLSAGCASSPKSRIARNQETFDAYPADVRAAISEGQAKVGFTAEQVRLALGGPDRVVTRTSEAGQSEVWIYRGQRPHLGLGFGVGMGGGPVGVGAGVGTGGGEFPDERLRVIFTAGRVSAVEQISPL